MKAFYTYSLTLLFFILMIFTISSCDVKNVEEDRIMLTSPSGTHTICFQMDNGKPMYAVSHNNMEVIVPSHMGFVFRDSDSLFHNFKVTNVQRDTVNETWKPVWGEKDSINNRYNQLHIDLEEKSGLKRNLQIQFRAFDDGVAFRYLFPEQKSYNDSIIIMDELTEFHLKQGDKAWWIPAYQENRYEYLYEHTAVNEIDTVHTPLTIENKNGVILSIHEANLVDFASMTLVRSDASILKSDLVPWSDGVKVRTTKSFKTPWRTIQIAETPVELISSDMILNLNEPNQIEDTSWIKPFKYMGIWWGMHIGKYTFWEDDKHGATTKNAKDYIDYANRFGIHQLLIEGWNKGWTPQWYENRMHVFNFIEPTADFDMQEVVDYGRKKGVTIVGYHETGSNIDNYLQQIDSAFAFYRKMGIEHVKIGHVGSKLNMKEFHHGQFGVNYFREVLKKAAKYKLTVNFHEPIKDTGERRTYPNMMTREGARGQEYNAWSEGNPPNHTAILPFTRMLSGPMDFTPGIFDVEVKQGYPGKRVHTTRAKQLALYVILYSPIQMLADLPENYLNEPAFQFLKDVPTDWSDTKAINGEIGQFVTIVRKDRKSEDWYLGSLTNEDRRKVEIPLSFLDEGNDYNAEIYTDKEGTGVNVNPDKVTINRKKVMRQDTLSLQLGESGGAVIRFIKL